MSVSSISKVGICGIGQMGSACAVAFARAGYQVFLWGRNKQKLESVVATIHQMNDWCDKHLPESSRQQDEIQYIDDLGFIDQEAEVVIDCIIEVMDEKVELLRQFSNAKTRQALFLSATSALSISEMASRSDLEPLLVGAHFWNPPHLIPMVEMVQGERTPKDKVQLACELMEDIGKTPIVCKDVPGFVGNRLLHAMWREALHMIDEDVCSAEDIDRITRLTFALRLPLLGPIENMDYVGLDATERLQKFMAPRLANNEEPAACLEQKIAKGELGVKSGNGFYDWSQRDIDDVLEKRDRQVLRQLEFLRELGEL